MRSTPICFVLMMVISSLSVSSSALAQSKQQQKTDSVFRLVQKRFNAKDADGLYALAGADLKKALIIETFRNICTYNLFPLGQITGSDFISFTNNNIATNKLSFSTGTAQQLLMSLDDQDKLHLFLFQPVIPPAPDKTLSALSTNQLLTSTDKRVDSVARPYIQKAHTAGLSIGVYKNGGENYYGYGETTIGNGKIPGPNTIFELGSITKTFTSTLLAYYAGLGKINLNDAVIKYLPDSLNVNPALKSITLLMLSNHTSGLPRLPEDFFTHITDQLNPYKGYSRQLMFAYLKTFTPKTIPGEQYAYSNTGAALLGLILEQVSGKSYEDMVEEIICGPLQMNSTVQHLTPMLQPQFVTVYNDEGQPTPAWDWDAYAPAGGLRSTAADLLKYARANMDKGQTPLLKAMQMTHTITYNKDVKVAMSWHMIVVNGVEYYFHDGGTGGCSTF